MHGIELAKLTINRPKRTFRFATLLLKIIINLITFLANCLSVYLSVNYEQITYTYVYIYIFSLTVAHQSRHVNPDFYPFHLNNKTFNLRTIYGKLLQIDRRFACLWCMQHWQR